ncbi:hypothetical protein EDEG_02764 [Edhazardia aedis USNM 41457]|uniref:Uncharacterized protein n=1 Tax=Edhazardia aedis (strain USNM 41457) TaxID=1003232 RepID=J9D4V6_EDHAE|nr:hypothetical protein EDEG_02764 [Edhazardia aedis USNM 41457]|eukprot:EJW02851.1 hypothetical protein EDEG_02764 [Edhazardia aedis USNM 41457]
MNFSIISVIILNIQFTKCSIFRRLYSHFREFSMKNRGRSQLENTNLKTCLPDDPISNRIYINLHIPKSYNGNKLRRTFSEAAEFLNTTIHRKEFNKVASNLKDFENFEQKMDTDMMNKTKCLFKFADSVCRIIVNHYENLKENLFYESCEVSKKLDVIFQIYITSKDNNSSIDVFLRCKISWNLNDFCNKYDEKNVYRYAMVDLYNLKRPDNVKSILYYELNFDH